MIYAYSTHANHARPFLAKRALPELGLPACKVGRAYRKWKCCPVNGDGYWSLRRHLLTQEGEIVGSYEYDTEVEE